MREPPPNGGALATIQVVIHESYGKGFRDIQIGMLDLLTETGQTKQKI